MEKQTGIDSGRQRCGLAWPDQKMRPRLLEIYAPYVAHTAITFEYAVPSPEEFRGRIERILARYPYLVARQGDRIVDYADAFHPRPAYGWAVETPIYVDSVHRRCGIGGALYAALKKILAAMHILNVNACLACPESADEYLDKSSLSFHERLGYRVAGEFHRCGYKFGRWYNVVWLEKSIGEHVANPPAVLNFTAHRALVAEQDGIR